MLSNDSHARVIEKRYSQAVWFCFASTGDVVDAARNRRDGSFGANKLQIVKNIKFLSCYAIENLIRIMQDD